MPEYQKAKAQAFERLYREKLDKNDFKAPDSEEDDPKYYIEGSEVTYKRHDAITEPRYTELNAIKHAAHKITLPSNPPLIEAPNLFKDTKRCAGCGEKKQLYLFSVNPRGHFGRHSICKACKAKKDAERYQWKRSSSSPTKKPASAQKLC